MLRWLAGHSLLLLLVGIDVATKVAAFTMLPLGQVVTVLPGIDFYLAVNDWGVMGGVHGIGAVTGTPSYTMTLALGLVLLAAVIVRLASSGLSFAWRLLIGTGAFFAVAFAAQAAGVALAGVAAPPELVVVSIRLAALAVSLALYAASSSPLARAAFTLFAAGGLANAVSFLYPPFEVVDFLVVPIAPVLVALGRPGAEATVGVVNVADLYVFLFPFVLLAWWCSAAFRGVRGLWTGTGGMVRKKR